jgi:demethylmenaquinone methyltransferase/2-methoxy-6-polyprenyl-1,4-benzoquinol methylase
VSGAQLAQGGRGHQAMTDLPVGSEKTRLVRSMFDAIAPRYDLVNRLMTFGLDQIWRRRSVAALGLPQGSAVLDLASGTGDLSRELERRGLQAVGVDLSWGMLAARRAPGAVAQGDGAALPLGDGTLDGAVSGFALRNLTDLRTSFEELARVLRPGGRVALLDVAPMAGLRSIAQRLWFERAAPVIGSLLSDPTAYRYLPRSVAYLPPPATLVAELRRAGFSAVQHRVLPPGVVQLLTATRRGRAGTDR